MERPDHEPSDEAAGEDSPQPAAEAELGPEEGPAPLSAEPRSNAEQATGEPQEALPGRWRLLRDAAAFQVKLVVDGMRDVMLSPLSLIAAIAGLALGRHEWFYDLLQLGRRSERWIDLFSAVRRLDDGEPAPAPRRRNRPPRPKADRRTQAEPEPPTAEDEPKAPDRPRTWYSDSRWSSPPGGGQDAESIDDLIAALESRLQEQYRRGGVTARAKHTIDRMLDAVGQRYREGRRPPP